VGGAERTAVLVIRAWLQDDREPGAVCARITQTLDVSRRGAVDTAAGSEDEVLAIVRAWLLAVGDVGDKPVTGAG
jgi:hypothetical protein